MTTSRPGLRCTGVLLVLVLAVVGAACSSTASGRPATSATLQIVTPEPNATTGSNVDLRLKLRNAEVVPAAQVGGTIRPDRGHIHVSVDGQVTQMYYGVVQTVPNLTPGEHTIQAEFVAADHAPFANRVVAAVTFEVK
jgi:uncharacterized protein (DUF58 family)